MTDSTKETRKTQLLQNWPEAGDVLTCLEGEPALVTVEWRGKRRVMWTTAIIDSEATGWYLSRNPIGVKCMISDEFHDQIDFYDCDDDGSRVYTIEALHVIRVAVSSKALVCGVPDE